MSTTTAHARTEAVQHLYDGLTAITRSLRARSTEWAYVASDLSRGDVMALGVLERRGSIRPGQLATALNVGPSVVSRQLAALERLGLITRGTDPDDGRAELISINDNGRSRLRDARGSMCRALGDRLDHWDDDEIARAAATVHELAEQLREPLLTHVKESQEQDV